LREREYCNIKFFFQWNISFFSFTLTNMFFELLGNNISRSLDRHCVRFKESSTLVTFTLTLFNGNEGMMAETGCVIDRDVSFSSQGRMSCSTLTNMFFELLLGNDISRSLDRHCVRFKESSTLVTFTLTLFKGNEGMMVETGRVIDRDVSSSSRGMMSRSPSSEE
jgi:hypothetical protein